MTEHKPRVLKSLLQREMRGYEAPCVEAMVLLYDPNVQVRLAGQARAKVVTRANFARAITHGELPQVPAARTRRPVDKPTARAVRDALKALGLRAIETKVRIGDLELASPLLEEGAGYQDRLAEHPHMKGLERRVRCYVVPSSGSAERRAQLRRAAEREAWTCPRSVDTPDVGVSPRGGSPGWGSRRRGTGHADGSAGRSRRSSRPRSSRWCAGGSGRCRRSAGSSI